MKKKAERAADRTHRDYSQVELRQRLVDKGFDRARIDDALQRCLDLGYLDDARYALNRATSLMNQGRAVGPRILLDLRQRGISEEIAKTRQIPHCIGTFPFTGSGRARCIGETDGFVKLISHSKTDRLIGAHIIGPRASDMIAECVLAMEFGASLEDIARTIHGHPTFSETLQEAASVATKCSIYG